MATILRAGQSGVRVAAGAKFVESLVQDSHTDSGAYPPSYSMGTGVLSGVQSGRGLNLTTHFHLVPRLRASGAINPAFPLVLN
jgi:hypothetical protein